MESRSETVICLQLTESICNTHVNPSHDEEVMSIGRDEVMMSTRSRRKCSEGHDGMNARTVLQEKMMQLMKSLKYRDGTLVSRPHRRGPGMMCREGTKQRCNRRREKLGRVIKGV